MRGEYGGHYGAQSIIGENSRFDGATCVEHSAVLPPGTIVMERGMVRSNGEIIDRPNNRFMRFSYNPQTGRCVETM